MGEDNLVWLVSGKVKVLSRVDDLRACVINQDTDLPPGPGLTSETSSNGKSTTSIFSKLKPDMEFDNVLVCFLGFPP